MAVRTLLFPKPVEIPGLVACANSAPDPDQAASGPLVTVLNEATPGSGTLYNLPADGWLQYAPFGEFPGQSTANPPVALLQVFNRADAGALLSDFNRRQAAGQAMFVDFNHAAGNSAAWVEDMQIREDGLYFKPRWVSSGLRAAVTGEFRFGSPTWTLKPVAKNAAGQLVSHPVALGDFGRHSHKSLPIFALTNTPNILDLAAVANGAQPTSAGTVPAGNHESMHMLKDLNALLGLPADTTLETALNSVRTLQASAAKVQELQGALNSLRADQRTADLETFKGVITADNKASVEKLLDSDRPSALVILNGWVAAKNAVTASKPVTRQPLHVAANAGTPDPARSTADATGKDQRLLNRARELQKEQGLSFQVAFNAACSEMPEAVTSSDPE